VEERVLEIKKRPKRGKRRGRGAIQEGSNSQLFFIFSMTS